jgi:hypothetical protein
MKIEVRNYRVANTARKNDLHITMNVSEGGKGITNVGAVIGMKDLSYFIGRVPNTAISMLYLASIVYAIDRSFARDKYSIDGWSREFEVDIALPYSNLFSQNATLINRMLSYLTGDYWTCSFREFGGAIRLTNYRDSNYFDGITQVNLFSGGMDSLIGAIDYMGRNPEGKLFLASHHDSNMAGPMVDQQRLIDYFKRKYLHRYLRLPNTPSVKIEADMPEETSCRSRSLMFIAIAVVVASNSHVNVEIPENGSVSLNFPLSPSRRASCSTRTTHPMVVKMLIELLPSLGVNVNISNPYEFCTKGEMVVQCANISNLLEIVPESNSCGKRGRKQYFYDHHDATHCGHCMPCMYRMAALQHYINNLPDDEKANVCDNTVYGNEMPSLFRRRGDALTDDFYAMLNFLKRPLRDDDIRKELRIAGMGTFLNINDYVQLVHRTRAELMELVQIKGGSEVKQYMGLI